MSGTGGTVYDATPPIVSCERLNFKTILNSPNPAVISKIKRALSLSQVLLDIQIQKRGELRIAAAIFEGEIAGAITSDSLLRLMECIETNYSYVADVRDVTGARVEVQVYLK